MDQQQLQSVIEDFETVAPELVRSGFLNDPSQPELAPFLVHVERCGEEGTYLFEPDMWQELLEAALAGEGHVMDATEQSLDFAIFLDSFYGWILRQRQKRKDAFTGTGVAPVAKPLMLLSQPYSLLTMQAQLASIVTAHTYSSEWCSSLDERTFDTLKDITEYLPLRAFDFKDVAGEDDIFYTGQTNGPMGLSGQIGLERALVHYAAWKESFEYEPTQEYKLFVEESLDDLNALKDVMTASDFTTDQVSAISAVINLFK